MDSLAAMPYGLLTGPNNLYGYDPKTGKMYPLEKDGFGGYNLTTIMGGAEVVFELNEVIDHPAWQQGLAAILPTGQRAERGGGARHGDRHGRQGRAIRARRRLAAYVYRQTNNLAFASKAWKGMRLRPNETIHLEGPAVLNPIDEVPGVSTNGTAQGSLEAIEVLEMCGNQMPRTC